MTIRRLIAIGGAALALGACDNPSEPLPAPQVRSLSLYMVLDPDQPDQPLLVKAPQAADPVLSVHAEVLRNGARVESIALAGDGEDDNPYPCTTRYGSIIHTGGAPRCLAFRFTPQHGATYRVAAGAQSRPDASAVTTVPGAFEIRAVAAEGDVPGTAGLRASWTPSEGVFSYVVALRSDSLASCYYDPTCSEPEWDAQAWWIATTDTTIETTVPRDRVRGGMGGWRVEVYAMDRAIFEYLTTGTNAEPFPVPPRQNVQGGYGAVGSWVRRSVPVGP